MDIKEFCKLYDLQVYDTGGGHLALTNNSTWDCGGFYWLITDKDEDNELPAGPDVPVCVGLYHDASGDMVAWWIWPDMYKAVEFMKQTCF